MQLKQNIEDIYKVLTNDETLLRLLINQPTSPTDDPLDPTKPNILDMSATDRQALLDDRIYFTKSVDDLTTKEICRIIFYPGNRRTDPSNFQTSSQEFVFDVLAHMSYNNVDVRCQWICDRIEELLFDNKVTGTKSVRKVTGRDLMLAPNYASYELVFEFGSVN
jgi:hypothetical protein